ncbi:hypothetical protein AJ79_07530 [Helicocarpus griseus UAMH5409]|uniref:D-lactate dehydrogenase n=1 Tax=Helicocarpus griseus UAMH5409 TaxID=1447875 RepID=A0A2B7WU23_9EURO|nr:hypothetical protein AJ79_07530 [Helicocarpus griseus UAMH5409]
MKIIVFSTEPYDRKYLEQANKQFNHELDFHEARLTSKTAILAAGYPVVSVFVNDEVNAPVLEVLARNGTKMVALRCRGFSHVDLGAAKTHGITIARVPRYCPHAVAEYTIGLFLSLDRKIHRAWDRVREDTFDLNELEGRDLYGKTVGIVGTGRIGARVAKAFKPNPDLQQIDIPFYGLEEVLRGADILCLHCPLTPETRHLINADSLKLVKRGVVIVNTARADLVDIAALVPALESRQVGGLALDVYENEVGLFLDDSLGGTVAVHGALFQRLRSFPNVIITGHQAYFTQETLHSIAHTTLNNAAKYEAGKAVPFALI